MLSHKSLAQSTHTLSRRYTTEPETFRLTGCAEDRHATPSCMTNSFPVAFQNVQTLTQTLFSGASSPIVLSIIFCYLRTVGYVTQLHGLVLKKSEKRKYYTTFRLL